MAYEVHITRKPNWFDETGPAITLEEWRKYAAGDNELKLDALPEPTTAQGTIRMESPGAALWSGAEAKGGKIWFRHFRDRITVKDPDTDTLIKMHRISTALGGKVQGHDGELYASDGSSSRKPKSANGPATAAPSTKRSWWKFGS